jgi:diguanylate cyclase (GGDEF)-like protein/PAS domain S-box-containing protein
LASDYAETHASLDRFKSYSRYVVSIELYSKRGNRLYPVDETKLPDTAHEVFVHRLKHKNESLGRLVTKMDVDRQVYDEVKQIRKLEWSIILIFFTVLVIIGYLQHRWVRMPLQTLMDAMSELIKGNYNVKIMKSQSGELFRLTEAFAKMRDILKKRDREAQRQKKLDDLVRDVQTNYISATDRHTIFNRMLTGVLDVLDSKIGFIGELEYDEDKNPLLQIYAISNIAWDVESRLIFEKSINDKLTFTQTNTLFGKVMTTGKIVIDNHAALRQDLNIAPKGHPVIERFLGIPIYDRESRLVGVVAVANSDSDYTEQAVAELKMLWLSIGNLINDYRNQMQLKRSEEGLRALLQSAIDAIITFNSQGKILSFNPAAEKMFQYKSEEVINKDIRTLLPATDGETTEDIAIEDYVMKLSAPAGGQQDDVSEVTVRQRTGTELLVGITLSVSHLLDEVVYTGIIRDITERKKEEVELKTIKSDLEEANRKLRNLAITDGLTGLSNRRDFDEKFHSEFQRAKRQKYVMSVMMLDVDHFKAYNDHYGHSEGDKCLSKVANALKGIFMRNGEVVARYGGEEFVIMLPYTSAELAKKMAESVIEVVQGLKIAHEVSDTNKHVTVSIGVGTIIPKEEDLADDFLILVDKALYEAKNNGRNQYALAGDLPRKVHRIK